MYILVRNGKKLRCKLSISQIQKILSSLEYLKVVYRWGNRFGSNYKIVMFNFSACQPCRFSTLLLVFYWGISSLTYFSYFCSSAFLLPFSIYCLKLLYTLFTQIYNFVIYQILTMIFQWYIEILKLKFYFIVLWL